ncbi:cryptochrome/photolyase family protein [Polynucleobacter sp. HIN7]|uniref:cryptochrome/photolyase family protein n=1 Tax=Polynucleobacter sp. HIN7 TaxID=3047866 RepID=UPI002572DB0C|nr:cryptochrome/photolyase family protein [Polynucleobacter sp. HIN7]
MRNLILVLGDQLNQDASAFDGFDPKQDAVWMAEVDEESTHIWSSKQRIALFISAMRHFAHSLRKAKISLHYSKLDDPGNTQTLEGELARTISLCNPSRLIMTAPGDWRVLEKIKQLSLQTGIQLEIREDRYFFATVKEFFEHAKGRKQLRLEYWYRELRKKHSVLMNGDAPVGGEWNFDSENRSSFGKDGPPPIPPPLRLKPDSITQEVIQLVESRFISHPGSVAASTSGFGWPIDRQEALQALNDFILNRLPQFGVYQDAMWTDEPWLFHSHIASALNLKLLSAQEVVMAAEKAYRQGRAPIAAVEGFIRQILGWREYVRGIYWMNMPKYLELNALKANQALPAFFWDGNTPMQCLSQTITQSLRTGYAHHIQRLMVTGLYALLLGVKPKEIHAWYLSMYVDAVEWVELPNVIGMSQFADGGLMASKPYIATGKYIDRMSNYCKHCVFKPDQSTGPDACPFTTLYWDFLIRHESAMSKNPRMLMQVRNLGRMSDQAKQAIQDKAAELRDPQAGK